MVGCPRYEHEALAWEYDQRINELALGELDWYLRHAEVCQGPTLAPACGSGRLLLPIAQAGNDVDGVDNLTGDAGLPEGEDCPV
jgi:2-polyprenyl-3-methyl-5-hydroxy-6-metoxy-1,4-benzoquinol methylase